MPEMLRAQESETVHHIASPTKRQSNEALCSVCFLLFTLSRTQVQAVLLLIFKLSFLD